MSIYPRIITALGLDKTVTATEIHAALMAAPSGSSAEYLLQGLPAYFSSLDDEDGVEEALEEACDEGSDSINRDFADALNEDAWDRDLVASWDESDYGTMTIDGFGDPFDLLDNLLEDPFKPPFDLEFVKALNDGFGYVTAEGDTLIALELYRARDDMDGVLEICEEHFEDVDLDECEISEPCDMADALQLVSMLREASERDDSVSILG